MQTLHSMNRPSFRRILIVAILASPAVVRAQQPQLRNEQTAQLQPAVPATPLSTNYRIVFSSVSGEMAHGELSTLTCSSLVRIEGPLGPAPAMLRLAGNLEERNTGQLLFTYTTELEVPLTTTLPGGSITSYQQQASSGSVLMKPGHPYGIFKAGSNSYTVTITPEPDK